MKTLIQTGAAGLLAVFSLTSSAVDIPLEKAQSAHQIALEALPFAMATWCGNGTGTQYDFNEEQRTLRAGDSVAWSCKNLVGVAGLAHAKDGRSVRIESEIHATVPWVGEAGTMEQLRDECHKLEGHFIETTPRQVRCESRAGTMYAEWKVQGDKLLELDIRHIGAWLK